MDGQSRKAEYPEATLEVITAAQLPLKEMGPHPDALLHSTQWYVDSVIATYGLKGLEKLLDTAEQSVKDLPNKAWSDTVSLKSATTASKKLATHFEVDRLRDGSERHRGTRERLWRESQ